MEAVFKARLIMPERNRADFQCRRENETFLARIVL